MASYLYSGTTGGNWSTAANWTNMSTNTTGTVPTSADDAYLHNKTVIIDSGVTVNVNKISNRATTGFTVSTNYNYKYLLTNSNSWLRRN
jgi:phosphatidylserine/phosphatidylglycerophosphate/cardiolipin synthase-like enzyme